MSQFVCDEPQITPRCVTCSTSFSYPKPQSGRIKRSCSDECRKSLARVVGKRFAVKARSDGRYREREKAERDARFYEFVCVVCSNAFHTRWHRAKCCSPECVSAHARAVRLQQGLLQREARKRICVQCEKSFLPSRPNQAQKAAGYVQQCCSPQCRHQMDRVYASQAMANKAYYERKRALMPPKRCKACDKTLLDRVRSYCGEDCRPIYVPVAPKEITRPCSVCEKPFTYTSSGRGRRRSVCSKACIRAQNIAIAKRAKVRRREARTGDRFVETVIPMKVFERDGWRCQECRRPTPRKLRGTTDPRAPELDHIVSVADGGEHSYRNTQCLCRACNAAKGRTSRGQFALL